MPLLENSKEIVMNTKTMIAGLAIGATGFAGAAMAHEMDTDGDGAYSLIEIQSDFPDLTEAEYASLDTNQDGQVDADEVAAARIDGPLKTSE